MNTQVRVNHYNLRLGKKSLGVVKGKDEGAEGKNEVMYHALNERW